MVELPGLIGILHVTIFVLVVTDIRKNKELFSGFVRWFLYLFVLFVPIGGAFLYLFLVLSRSEPTKICPHCKTEMSADASSCPDCGFGASQRTVMGPKHCHECGETFDTFRGLHHHRQEHD